MTVTRTFSSAARIHVAALVVASVGFLVLLAAGVPELQPFPPGVVVLLGAALATVLLPRWRWVPLIGAGLGLVICFGAFFIYAGTVERLMNPSEIVLFGGTALQMGGVIVGVLAGVTAALRGRSSAATVAAR